MKKLVIAVMVASLTLPVYAKGGGGGGHGSSGHSSSGHSSSSGKGSSGKSASTPSKNATETTPSHSSWFPWFGRSSGGCSQEKRDRKEC